MRDNRSEKIADSDWAMDVAASKPDPVRAAKPATRADDDRPFQTKGNVLTQAEIEALLRPNLPDDIGLPVEPERIEPRAAAQFDDTQKASPATEAMRQTAGLLAARLSLSLGQSSGIKAAIGLRDVQPVQTSALPGLMTGKAGAVACFGANETDTSVLICLPGPLADALIAQACGARGSTGRIGDGWTLSAIDCALLEQLLGPVSAALGTGLSLQAIETDVPYVTSLLPAGEVLIAEYSVEATGLRSELAVITSAAGAVSAPPPETLRGTTPMTAVVTARIASLSVPLSHLTSLKAGSTLLLGLPADQPVDVLSGGRDGALAFEGQVGRKGDKVAVKITRKLRGVLD